MKRFQRRHFIDKAIHKAGVKVRKSFLTAFLKNDLKVYILF